MTFAILNHLLLNLLPKVLDQPLTLSKLFQQRMVNSLLKMMLNFGSTYLTITRFTLESLHQATLKFIMIMDFVNAMESNGIFTVHSGLIRISLKLQSDWVLLHIIQNATQTTDWESTVFLELIISTGITELCQLLTTGKSDWSQSSIWTIRSFKRTICCSVVYSTVLMRLSWDWKMKDSDHRTQPLTTSELIGIQLFSTMLASSRMILNLDWK